ncbi:hypothetical protein [Nocardia sp. NPDC050710]|uniref:hypothetical protein n=1 Tax=Nocardia sp. NPDC050710 TaxID=3157220 RepID=UPI0033EE495B
MQLSDTADVPERDNREAWLAYVDLLTAASDSIRLGHNCETEDGIQVQLVTAYKARERKLVLDGPREDGRRRFTRVRG